MRAFEAGTKAWLLGSALLFSCPLIVNAAQAAELACIPFDSEALGTTFEAPSPSNSCPGLLDTAVTANRIVASQTLSSVYSAKAADKQAWVIFIATVIVLSFGTALICSVNRYFGLAFEFPDFATLIFASGLVAVVLGVFIPLQILRHVDGA